MPPLRDFVHKKILKRQEKKTLKTTRPAGLEPATFGFEVRDSIQLSYGRTHTQIIVE